MPLSCLRRPLAAALILFMALLAFLRSRSVLDVDPIGKPGRRSWACVEGLVVSGFSPKRLGDRFWLRTGEDKLMVYAPRDSFLRPGQRVRLEGLLRPGRRALNPGEFDEDAFLADRGASGVLHARRVEPVGRPAGPFWRLWAAAESAHRALHDYLYRRFAAEDAALLEGFLLGYKGPISRRLNRQIQDAGVMHLIVPSGAKVAFVLAFALWIGARCGAPPGGRLVLAAAAGGFYVLMAGPEPPYTRAYFAALGLYAARLLGRETGAFSALALSALLTLLLKPRALFETGFQMTYLAALGLLIALPRWRLPRRWSRPARAAAAMLLASLVVQASLWPVFAGTFGRGSILGVASNLLLIPASGLVMAGGFLSWAASGLPWGLDAPIVVFTGALVSCFKGVCAASAALPGAAVDLAPWTGAALAAYYLALLGCLLVPEWSSSLRAWSAAAALASFVWARSRARGGDFSAVFFRLPKGYATLLTLPGQRRLLVEKDASRGTLEAALRALGVRPDAVWSQGAASGGFSYRQGRLRLRLERGRARIRMGGSADYCIMPLPTRSDAAACAPERSFSVREDGAVMVHSDGESLEITTFGRRDTLGRAVP